MKLELKYNLGNEVYVIFKENGIIHLFKDKIVEFAMSEKNGLHYYVDGTCEEFKENELILATREDLLLEKIKELSNEIEIIEE